MTTLECNAPLLFYHLFVTLRGTAKQVRKTQQPLFGATRWLIIITKPDWTLVWGNKGTGGAKMHT